MKNKKIVIIIVVVLVILSIVGVGSFAWFNYYQTSSLNNLLVASDIRLNLSEGLDTITLTNVFPESKEEARSHDGNTLTFTVSGTNTTNRAILYEILLNHGSDVSGKTRFSDNELRFDLVEIVNNNEVYLVSDTFFSSLTNANIYDNVVPGNTNSVSHTYKLRVWIDENVTISETETGTHTYTPNAYKNLYATVKLAVKGETKEGDAYTVTFDADGGTVPINTKSVIAGQDYGYLPTPTKEGYDFLGWHGANIFNIDEMTLSHTDRVNGTDELTFSDQTYDRILNKNQWVPSTDTTYTLVMPILENSFDTEISLRTDDRFYVQNYATNVIESGSTNKFISTFTTKSDFTDVTLGSLWFWTSNTVSGTFRFKMAIYEGTGINDYEPYFIINSTNVVQNSNHTLKALWQLTL